MVELPLNRVPERSLYLRGVEHFNAHRFFDAHEVWEDAWRPMRAGVRREFFQAMIQCTVALEHYRRSNPHGVRTLFKTYTRHFADVPLQFMGLNVGTFKQQMHAVLDDVVESDRKLERGDIELDVTRVPRIEIDYKLLDASAGIVD